MKTIYLLLGCLLYTTIGFSQTDRAYYAKVAYQGGMVLHPGLNLGVAYPILHSSREKRNGQLVQREIRLGLNAGFYYHRRLNTGLNIGPEVEWLRTGSRGGQFGISLESGYLRTFIPGTYEVDDSGSISQATGVGTDHFFFSPGIRIGKILKAGKERALAWYIRPKLQFQRPYAGGSNNYFQTEIGITFKL